MRTSSPLRRTLYSIIGTAVCFFFLFPDTAFSQAYISSSKVYYPGSAGFTRTDGLVADNSANTYLLSRTQQNTFQPTIPFPAKGTGYKSVLMKHDANNNLLWSRYLPHSASGAGNTMFTQVVVDGNNVHLLGVTTSTDVPVTHGPAAGGGGSDIIYARVDATTGNLLTTLYLGGNGFDGDGIGLAVHGGQVFLTYTTTSNNIPTTDGSAYTSGYDHVMARMDEQANIVYCVYTGSVNTTATYTDTVSFKVSNGNAVLGMVVSNTNNFVTTDGSTVQGPYDYGIVKLGASGNKLFSIVYGGTGEEFSPEIEVLGNNVFITGITTSTNYPVTDGSAFPGSYRHVITKFNNSGQVVFSKYTAGIPAGTDYPQIAVEDGMVYVFGHAFDMAPRVNVTDGSSGGSYLIKMNAANGAVQFATRFGYVRTGSTVKASQLMVHNGQAFITFPAHNGPANLFTTDGSTMYTNGGTYIAALTETGKQFFGTGRQTALNDGRVITNMVKTGNRLTVISCHLSSATAHAPLTEPMTTPPATGGFLNLMTFEFCPSMPTENIISPLLQNICKGGFTQTISGNRVSKPSGDMPQLIKGGNVSPQMEILARYQWQVATSPTGPWTNIVGLGTQKDFTPPSASETRYYRRLVLPPFGCGDDPVSISDVAAVVVDVNAAPVVEGGVFNTCVGTPVDVFVNVSGGTAPYTYSWDNGIASTTNEATVTPSTNSVYTVTVTDNNGCQQAGQVIVNAYAADAGPDEASVCAGNPVRIGTTPPAGLAGVTYAWSPATGLDNASIAQTLASPAATTVYTLNMTVPITGGGTCMTSNDITVNVVAAPATPNFAGPDVAVCKGSTFTLGTPAEAGFTYTWSPGNYLSAVNTSQVTFDAGSLLPTPNPITYQLTASRNGCSFTDQVTVAVQAVDAGHDLCGPRTVGTEDLMPDIAGKTYLWEVVSGPGAITGPTNTPATTVSASVGGTTIYRLTVSYMGTTCSDEVEVPECSGSGNSCPIVDIDVVADQGCPSTALGAVTLRANPANLSPAMWTYTWSASPAGGISSTTGTSIKLTDNVERDITLTITSVQNPSISCSQTIHVNDPSWTLPVFNAQEHTICKGDVVPLGEAPVAGYSYQWKDVAPGDETLSNPSVSPDTTTYYPVKITEATSGCVFRDTAKVTVKSVFANPGNNWVTCNNVVIELGAPEVPGYTYSWFPQVAAYQDGTDHTSAQPKVLITTSQDFTLTVTDTETGCTHDSTISIIVDNGGTLTGLQDETICAGGSVVIGPPAQAGVTYSWSPATGLSSTTVAQPVASPTTTTVYTLSVTYYDALGNPICTKNGTVTITVDAPSITGMSDVNLCPSAPVHNLGTGISASGTGTLTYLWTPIHLVNTPTNLNSTIKANPTQPTTFTLTVTDGNGCTTSASKTITPTATLPDAGVPAQVCVGSSVQLGSTANTGSCSWTVSPAIAGTLSNANSPNPIFTPAAGDADKTFTFTLSEQIGGCTSKSTVDVTVRQFNLPSMPVQTICSNASTTIGVAPEANVTYIWSPATGLENPNAATTVVNNVTENRVYTLTGVHINGCIDQAQVTIGVNPVPAPTVVVPPVTVQVGSTPDPFQPQLTPASGSYTYSWSPAQSVNNPYIPNATAYSGGIGNTTYTLTVTDENGCTSTAQTQLSVVPLVATLPIHITSFRAIPALCSIQLKWETAQAENFSHFVIERSNNGTDYSEIAIIFHSSLRTGYQYTDNQRDNRKWYYRLKLVDKDGRFRYSPVVTAQATCLTSTTLKVYPNPARNYVHIESSQPVKRVVLLSITGQVLMQQDMNPANTNRLYFPGNVKPGIYVVGIWDKEGNIAYARLIKE